MYTIEILVCPPEPSVPTAGWTPTPSSPSAPTGGSTEGGITESGSTTTPTDPSTVEGAQGQLGGTPTLPLLQVGANPNTPCSQLKQMGENTNIKAKFTTLRNNINGTNEKGFLIRDIAGNETSDIVEGDGEGDIKYPYEDLNYQQYIPDTYGTAHNHNKNNPKHIGIFTPADLMQLRNNALIETHPANPKYSATPKKSVIFVMTDKGFFALKINDYAKFKNFENWLFVIMHNKVMYDNYNNNYFQKDDKYNIRPEATYEQQVEGFLRFLADRNAGVDLYEGDKNTFGNWKKLELEDNGNNNYSIKETPCNL